MNETGNEIKGYETYHILQTVWKIIIFFHYKISDFFDACNSHERIFLLHNQALFEGRIWKLQISDDDFRHFRNLLRLHRDPGSACEFLKIDIFFNTAISAWFFCKKFSRFFAFLIFWFTFVPAIDRNVAQLVAHYVRDVGVGRSSRLIPTYKTWFSMN